MYGGKLVEVGQVRDIFKSPMHPYTQLLISSLPSLDVKGVLRGIPGAPPSLLNPPVGLRVPSALPAGDAALLGRSPGIAGSRARIAAVACHLYD